MDPFEAANEYLQLAASAPLGAAASFARQYEDKASPEDFDTYLNAVELSYAAEEAA